MLIKDIIYREDLYPRFQASQKLIQQYANSIEYLPPIKVSQQKILIDGYHRLKAFQLEGKEDIPAEIIEVESEKQLKRLSYQLNSNHGLQLSQDEKRKYAVEMAEEFTNKELSSLLSINEATVSRWTKNKRDDLEQERDRKIIELYLRAWNTQEKIAKQFGVVKQTVSNAIEKSKKMQTQEIGQDFKPYLYNIWNLQKQDNAMEGQFGSFPNPFMENLLYYHTEPLDVVYDPMAGGGTTVDACKKMFRRYYCTDRKVTPGREADIKQYELSAGIPTDLPKPALVFLDPPYSILAKGEYADETENADLGNMTVEDFYQAFHAFITELSKWAVKQIAYLIRPFWVTGGSRWQWSDPTFELYKLLEAKYCITARYVLPYSSQQYTGLWVDRAKKQRKCLILNRELTIFGFKNGKVS